MSLKIIRHQFHFALRQRGAALAFLVLLALALWSFCGNVLQYQGSDVVEMVSPTVLLSISYNRSSTCLYYLVQIFPILVTCPAGFLLVSEKHQKEDLLLITRVGAGRYYASTVVSAFLVTMFVFTVPFLLELLLNCISFPTNATGIIANGNQYDTSDSTLSMSNMIPNFLFPELYRWNRYVYTVVCILLFGAFSGVLGAFTVALSAVVNVPYKVLLFLPSFFLLEGTVYLSEFVSLPYKTSWYHYVTLFDSDAKQPWLLAVFLLVLCAVAVGCVWWKSRRDQL